MILLRRPLLRSFASVLCIALALVFVATSAARVVNLSQHDLNLDHAHGHHDPLTTFAAMPGGDEIGASLADDRAGPDDDAKPGGAPNGHHHIDGPVGFYAAGFDVGVELTLNEQDLGGEPDGSRHGWPPKGPERPPRHLTTSA